MSITPTPNAKTPGFAIKIQAKETKTAETVLGTKTATTQLSYLMKVAVSKVVVGQKVSLDPDTFIVKERPYTLPAKHEDGTPNLDAGKEIMVKWLSL